MRILLLDWREQQYVLALLCNLACTYCVHARPSGDNIELLASQEFRRNQKMSVAPVVGLGAMVRISRATKWAQASYPRAWMKVWAG